MSSKSCRIWGARSEVPRVWKGLLEVMGFEVPVPCTGEKCLDSYRSAELETANSKLYECPVVFVQCLLQRSDIHVTILAQSYVPRALMLCTTCTLQDIDRWELADDHDGLRSTGDDVLGWVWPSRSIVWICFFISIFHLLLHPLLFSGKNRPG